MMNKAYIGLGSNLGESKNFLTLALNDLHHEQAIHAIECSSFYRSSPVDSTGPDYINAVAYIETSLSSIELLHLLQQIELMHGRKRPYRNAPRTLDLDILLFNNEISNDPILSLPHPRMHLRAFVLEPLQELINLLQQQGKKTLPTITFDIDLCIKAARTTGQWVEKIIF